MQPLKNLFTKTWQYAVALLFAALFGYPLVWMIYSSFKPTRELIQNVWALPSSINFDAYQSLFENPDFWLYYRNSILLVIVAVPLLTLVSAMAAYVFARLRIRGRNALFLLFLAGTMIPVHVTLIPLYAMLRDFGWLNSLYAMLFPFIGFNLPVSIYILRGFFEQIPVELEEAARIDGCSTPRLFWTIVLPLARPALTTVIVLSAVAAWNEYLFALTFVSGNNSAYTLPLGVRALTSALGSRQLDRMFTVLTLTALPILVIYFLAQRQIIKSITAGAVKG
jgi:raffinose/stachyose/melibiose transport system permease protein